MNDWKETLRERMPLLGHRNWIVVTDMAYPLQTNPGILTLFAPDDFVTVMAEVSQIIDNAPHVRPHIYLDSEQLALNEELCPGITAYLTDLATGLKDIDKAEYLPHEEIIHKLDAVSKLFQVVIIKTRLKLPYTSVFFELDCGYWSTEREQALRQALAGK